MEWGLLTMSQLTKNFKASEFGCQCGKCIYANGQGINRRFVVALQAIREIYGQSMPINSGIRCSEHNKKEGGASRSQHLPSQGCRAADIGVSDREGRVIIIREALRFGLSVGIHKNFIHLDNRASQRVFTY